MIHTGLYWSVQMHLAVEIAPSSVKLFVDATDVRIQQIVTRSVTPKCLTFFIVFRVGFYSV